MLQISAWTIYLYGPLPELVCHLDSSLRNVVIMRLLIVLDSIIIVRYIFTFHAKNPTAVQDEFWTLFINIWATGNGLSKKLGYDHSRKETDALYPICFLLKLLRQTRPKISEAKYFPINLPQKH